jgi:hypothetical protein
MRKTPRRPPRALAQTVKAVPSKPAKLKAAKTPAPKPATASKPPAGSKPATRREFDVCTSFAGEDRAFVEKVVSSLKHRRIHCFYDFDEQAHLLGKDLFTHLDKVYREDARYCLMFISKYYPVKQWTNHERKSIQARMFEGGEEYLIPIRLDDTEVPGVLPTIGYIDGRRHDPSQIAALIQTKIRGKVTPKKPKRKPPVIVAGRRINWTHMTAMRKLRKNLTDPVALALLDLVAARAGQVVSFDEFLRHAGIREARQGMTALGVLTKTIKREFSLSPEKMSLPYERLPGTDQSGQTSYRMTPEVAQVWLKSALPA